MNLNTTDAPAWGPTGREVYERTYSRVKANGENETWLETVTRVVDGNLALVGTEHIWPNERELLIGGIYNFEMLPAGRHLWTSGVPGRQFNRNCHRAGWTPQLSEHFAFMFDELMKGGGVGANYSADYMARTDAVLSDVVVTIGCDTEHANVDEFIVDPAGPYDVRVDVADTRQGWVDALRMLIDLSTSLAVSAACAGTVRLLVDVSAVRERGEPLKGFGGTASGPAPLVDVLRNVAVVLRGAQGRQITGLEAMSVDHAIAQCVVAGNVRRSARMSVMHWNDPDVLDFITCKADMMDHWTTNISVEIDDAFFDSLAAGHPHAVYVNARVQNCMLANGEPGFFNSSLASVGERGDVRCTNPCGEIALEEWESCNLGHVNLSGMGMDGPTEVDAMPFVLMARFLVRATFVELLDKKQAAVERRNRRVGVGILGFQEWLVQNGVRYSEVADSAAAAWALEHFAAAATAAADRYADSLGIPRPVKHTTVAPTGTVAKLAGVSEGIHPIYSRYFVRRVRYANGNAALAELVAQGYETEPCIYNPNTTVVLFHVRDAILDVGNTDLVEQADELTVAEKLSVQEVVQRLYADNAVSFTVNMSETTTPEELYAGLFEYLPRLKGTTVFPFNSRAQSPYTAITEAEYGAAVDQGVSQSFDECASGACPVR
jgi:ribonucleoside-triphosphate reductase